MTAPYLIGGNVAGSGVTSVTMPVTGASAVGDLLAVGLHIAGTAPVVQSVTDSQGNVYGLIGSPAATGPAVSLYAAQGRTTAPLTTADTITATFASATTNGCAIIAAGLPGVTATDKVTPASGTSTTASAAATPTASGETAVAVFGWANAGGVGAMGASFTQLGQQHEAATSSGYLTIGYAASPTAGQALTASDTIVSAAWRAVLATFLPTPAGGGGGRDRHHRRDDWAAWW